MGSREAWGRQLTTDGHGLILPRRDPRGCFPDSAPGNVPPPLPGPREGTGGCKGLGPLRAEGPGFSPRREGGQTPEGAGQAAQGGPSGLVLSSTSGSVHPVLGMRRGQASEGPSAAQEAVPTGTGTGVLQAGGGCAQTRAGYTQAK